jgi:hypothetical protein
VEELSIRLTTVTTIDNKKLELRFLLRADAKRPPSFLPEAEASYSEARDIQNPGSLGTVTDRSIFLPCLCLLTQNSTDEALQESSVRWKIEQSHREAKGTTGIEMCQCRKRRSQRNHICCCLLVWHCLTDRDRQAKITIYQLKQRLLDDYMIKELKSPSIKFAWGGMRKFCG